MDATLKVLGGLLSEQTVRLARKLLIGRAEDCDLQLESDFVSAYHCILLLDEYTLRLRDLGSKNGTFVNGRRVGTSAIILLHDDNVCIGEVNLLVDLTLGLDGAELIPPPTASRPAPPSIFPQASDPVRPPQRQEDGNG
jgi:pSer/pThr/pTyr-binding forkhead associated (FHA) protein